MKKLLSKIFPKWLPLAVAISLIYGAMYVVIQQNYRQNANDPQIQYVEDVKGILEDGKVTPQNIVGQEKINPESSLTTFIIVFDKDKKAVASSATLSGGIPIPPKGTFDQKKSNLFGLLGPIEQNRFTWEPKKGTRVAAVLTNYKDGYVLAGRSLRVAEERIKILILTIAIAWAATLAATLASIGLIGYLKSKPKKLIK